MEIQHQIRGNEYSENTITSTNLQTTKQQQAASAPPSLPPSASSSPSHEFSFTISFHSSSPPNPNKPIPQQPPLAIDLTPADDIFFHGHLLPLHVMPNLNISPRSSTNSLDSFTLPIRGDQDKPHNIDACICSNCDKSKRHSFNSYEYNTRRNDDEELPTKKRVKSKSLTFFGLARRRKDGEPKRCEDESEKHKRKLKFDVSHFIKKYIRMFSKGRREDIHLRKQPYSFSGKLISNIEGRPSWRGRRREFSAPASMRTSPTNSGVVKTAPGAPPYPSSDSTMEELQAAIQAAIAHCKNSIATADKIN